MAGISEIGREATDHSEQKLESSAREYEEIGAEARQTIEDMDLKIDLLADDIRDIFG